MNSTLLSTIPWYTGVIRDCPRFSKGIVVDPKMEVRRSTVFQTFILFFLKRFVSGVDRFDGYLFSSNSFMRPQDLLLQKLMGIQVHIEGGVDVVRPCQNGLSDGWLAPVLATCIFTALCVYRLVDVLALLGGTHPPATVVERTAAPTETLQVCTLKLVAW